MNPNSINVELRDELGSVFINTINSTTRAQNIKITSNVERAFLNSHSQVSITNCYSKNGIFVDLQMAELTLTNCYFSSLIITITLCKKIKVIDCTIDKLEIHGNVEFLEIVSSSNLTSSFFSKLRMQGSFASLILERTTFRYLHVTEVNRTNLSANTKANIENCNTDLETDQAKRILNQFTLEEITENIPVQRDYDGNSPVMITNGIKELTVKASYLSIADIKSMHSLILFEDSEFKQIQISDSNTKNAEINSCRFQNLSMHENSISQLVIAHNSFNEFFTTNCKIEKAEILNMKSDHLYNKISFSFTTIERLSIRFIKINDLLLEQFTSKEKLIIQSTSIQDTLSIVDSSIEQSNFINLDLKPNVKFVLFNSNMKGTQLSTVNWMNDYLINKKMENDAHVRKNIHAFLAVKDSYRQLKEISLNSFNKFDALNFQRHELRVYKDVLWLKKNYVDFFLLKTNELFNNYGLSYIRPFRWLLLIHLILNALMILNGKVYTSYTFWPLSNSVTYAHTMQGISDYFSTLFPIHSFDYLRGLKGWPVLIDLAMRVSSGYFIYYFISATRKFHIGNGN